MKRKVTAISLAILLALLMVLVGCSKEETPASSSKASASTSTAVAADTSTQDEPRTYSWFLRSQFITWLRDLKWYDVAEERTGIHVDYVEGPLELNDTFNEVDQRLASGTLPDGTMLRLAQAKVYGAQGAFVDLRPYIEKYAPNIQAYLDANPDYERLISSDDGAIYAMIRESPVLADFIGYRADHFRAVGIDPAEVTTVEDLTEAMRALKAYYGKDNPNYYPFSGRENAPTRFAYLFDAASYADAEGSSGIYYSHEKDYSFDIKAPRAYEWIQTIKTWYDEGLINPSWIDGTNTEGDWESQMLSGNASLFLDFYNRAEWFMTNGGPDNDPDFDMQVLPWLVDDEGNILKQTSALLWRSDNAVAINASCDEETIRTILEFIDYFYSEEGMILANWGVEGESFKTNEDGSREFIVDYTAEESKPEGTKKWSFLSDRQTVCKPVDQEAFYAWNTPLIAEAASRYLVPEALLDRPVLVYTTEQEQELSNLVASVYNAELAGLTGFIVGNTPLNEETWNAFVEQMDALGLQRIEDIQYEAYKTTFGL